MAARSVWSGSISFGLVTVPVKFYSGTTAKSIRFHQIAKATGARIKQKRVDSQTGEEVPFEEIVKGYELSSDRYVLIDPEELENLAPKQTKMVEIEEFVPLEQIDPIVYNSSYHIVPADAGAARAYKLLATAMLQTDRVGIGRVVMRTKEYLAAVRAVEDGHLICSTMLFPDEVNRTDVDLSDARDPSDVELKQASMLIEALTTDFDHSSYEDRYRAQVVDLIERKAAGEEIAMPAATEEEAPVPDLMDALTASLEAAKAKKKPSTKKPSTKKAKTPDAVSA